jgi:hypothetical protein
MMSAINEANPVALPNFTVLSTDKALACFPMRRPNRFTPGDCRVE